MGVINITQKAVDILVNGGQEASFNQRANSADYNVDVSLGSLSWTEVASIDDNGSYTVTNPSDYLWRLEVTNIGPSDEIVPAVWVFGDKTIYLYRERIYDPTYSDEWGGLPITAWVGKLNLPKNQFGNYDSGYATLRLGADYADGAVGTVSVQRSTDEVQYKIGSQYGDEQYLPAPPITANNVTQS
jgi:hypothetical protein